jgi:hypothetical protein
VGASLDPAQEGVDKSVDEVVADRLVTDQDPVVEGSYQLIGRGDHVQTAGQLAPLGGTFQRQTVAAAFWESAAVVLYLTSRARAPAPARPCTGVNRSDDLAAA